MGLENFNKNMVTLISQNYDYNLIYNNMVIKNSQSHGYIKNF